MVCHCARTPHNRLTDVTQQQPSSSPLRGENHSQFICMIRIKSFFRILPFKWRNTPSLLTIILILTSCTPPAPVTQIPFLNATPVPELTATPYVARPTYKPGELVDYTVQAGDTMPALAGRFNTTLAEIYTANPIIPQEVTTLPVGMPMKIPIYYLPLWGSQFQILPNAAFINGPAARGFDSQGFVDAYPGWLKDYKGYAGGETRSGAGIVDYVANNFSVSPRLLLALLEYQSGALTNPDEPDTDYVLGYVDPLAHRGVYLQLTWAANTLNNGYYSWRIAALTEFEHTDGRIERPDPWQNAASVGIQYYLSRTLSKSAYEHAIGPEGIADTYLRLFGDPWADVDEHIPNLLQQPEFLLPFPRGDVWTYTGGPHTGWGEGAPFAAVDFAPPTEVSGCFNPTAKEFATAVADSVVARLDRGVVVIDLDMDGDERTGWTLLYLHIATPQKVALGTILKAGDFVGYPSCEGGTTTGTHLHIARKYNGEWIPADSPMPFNMEGWIPHNGTKAYQGTLSRDGFIITASPVSDMFSSVPAGQ